MGVIYKIHPAIGIARVGNHPTAFFVGPESVGGPGMEIGAGNLEIPVAQYKDGGKIKRQAARFRVFRFQQDNAGNEQLAGEVTADEAHIEWKVDLVNRKAALDRRPAPGLPATPRNRTVADRNSLIIRNPQPVATAGRSQPPRAFNGSFLNTPVYLGEIRTDANGRLLVLGGRGQSASVPVGRPLPTFANNDKWHDDVSDGPVSAVVTLPGETPLVVHQPAWVVVAPPDFAPGINSIVSLFDVSLQAAIEKGALKADPMPSFQRYIKPLIENAIDMRWTNTWDRWNGLLPIDWNVLADQSSASAQARATIAALLRDPSLDKFSLPGFLATYVDQWAAGAFISDLNDTVPALSVPDQLDRAALCACVGNNFFPGIEASINLRDRDIYAQPFRLDQTNLGKVYPGCLSEIMAVPWQADFMDCNEGVWWPSQRPDIAMTDAGNIPNSQADWQAPLTNGDHKGMVENAMRMGFVVPVQANGRTVFIEAERDPTFVRIP